MKSFLVTCGLNTSILTLMLLADNLSGHLRTS